jgi:hypothetical protein
LASEAALVGWAAGFTDLSSAGAAAAGVELWAIAMPAANTRVKVNGSKARKKRNFMRADELLEKHFEPLNCMFLWVSTQGFTTFQEVIGHPQTLMD